MWHSAYTMSYVLRSFGINNSMLLQHTKLRIQKTWGTEDKTDTSRHALCCRQLHELLYKRMLQGCYRNIILVLQRCYRGNKGCYKWIFQGCYMGVTWMLQKYYMGDTGTFLVLSKYIPITLTILPEYLPHTFQVLGMYIPKNVPVLYQKRY